MKNPKVIAGLVVGLLFVIFLFQNMDDVALRLYFWQVSMPKIILVRSPFLSGLWQDLCWPKSPGNLENP